MLKLFQESRNRTFVHSGLAKNESCRTDAVDIHRKRRRHRWIHRRFHKMQFDRVQGGCAGQGSVSRGQVCRDSRKRSVRSQSACNSLDCLSDWFVNVGKGESTGCSIAIQRIYSSIRNVVIREYPQVNVFLIAIFCEKRDEGRRNSNLLIHAVREGHCFPEKAPVDQNRRHRQRAFPKAEWLGGGR